MKQVSIAALGLALALGSVAAMPALAKDAKPAKEAAAKPSPEVMKAAGPIQAALEKKDYATAKPLVDAVAPQVVNDDDKYYVGHWMIQIGQGLNDDAETVKGLDMTLSSAKPAQDEVARLAFAQGQYAYIAKDYAKAAASMQRALDAGSTQPNVVPIMIDSLIKTGQASVAMKSLSDAIAKLQAVNQPVDPAWYGRGYLIAFDTKPSDPNYAAVHAQGLELAKKWVAATPKGDTWHEALLLYRPVALPDPELKLDLFRLNLAASALHGGPEYMEYVDSVYQRFPGEAKAVLDAGVRKGVVSLSSNRDAGEINGIVSGKIAADKASLAGSDKSARASGNPKALVSTADAYLTYGDYAKAIDLYALALSKGANADLVNTRLGEAQYGAGDKAAAKASFAKVGGNRKDLADFWTVLIDHPVAG